MPAVPQYCINEEHKLEAILPDHFRHSWLAIMGEKSREDLAYMARLAEQAERYDGKIFRDSTIRILRTTNGPISNTTFIVLSNTSRHLVDICSFLL